jgi:serine protease Do
MKGISTMKHNVSLLHWFLIPWFFFLANPVFANIPVNISLAPMLQKVLPAVVNLTVQIRPERFAPSTLQQEQNKHNAPLVPENPISVGSGVIVDAKNGYILTNVHVVEDGLRITVTLNDGRHFTAKVIGIDKPSDVALLQIKAKNLASIPIGDSNLTNVGDVVAVIGSPFGQLTQSVTSGIVSALGRATLGIEGFENFIQTDAPINPGNSGGALVNANGQLIGINTAIVSPQQGSGIGFAIPASMAKSVMLQLIQYGNVHRGALGVGAQDITPQLASSFDLTVAKGAVITQIMPNSPAEKTGIQVGDVITSINGSRIMNANDVVNAIAFLRVGSKADISILRNNKVISLSTTITDPQKNREAMESKDPFLFGTTLKNFELSDPVHRDVQGVLVVAVDIDSTAWHSDLRPGDIVVSANREKITDINELRKVAAKAKDSLLLNVYRGPAAIFLIINREET